MWEIDQLADQIANLTPEQAEDVLLLMGEDGIDPDSPAGVAVKPKRPQGSGQAKAEIFEKVAGIV